MTADGFANGLPNSIETRLVQIDRAGGLKALQSRYDVMATECMHLEGMFLTHSLIYSLTHSFIHDDDKDDDDDNDNDE